jgi:hypothetical protein
VLNAIPAVAGAVNSAYLSSSLSLVTPSVTTTLGVGGATPATSGAGITFPATQSASTDANTLDDYEEGTFTLTITPGSGSLTSYDRYGYYVKIGRSVTVVMAFSIITAGTAAGIANFSGLPFTSLNPTALAAGGNRAGTLAVREDGATGIWYFGFVSPNATSGTISTSTNGAITWTNGYAYVTSFVYESAS